MRPLNRTKRISLRSPISFCCPFDWLLVLLPFPKSMTRISRIDSLIDELQDVRKWLSNFEESSLEWNRFDRLEDKLCAELASEYAESV